MQKALDFTTGNLETRLGIPPLRGQRQEDQEFKSSKSKLHRTKTNKKPGSAMRSLVSPWRLLKEQQVP